MEFFASKATRGRADYPTFDKWYRKKHKKVYPVSVMGMPSDEEAEIQLEAAKIAEESKVNDPIRHPFKYPTDKVTSINKKISISIKFNLILALQVAKATLKGRSYAWA